ncbi:Alpha/beta hydrolase, partial [hydrothermal vent metagenome]
MKTVFKECLIDGVIGRLEVRYVAEAEPLSNKSKKLVVLSHPHPLHGGTMDNKVVTTMARAFHSLGYTAVTYNFRGVGKSEGEYDHGVGEQDDLMAVVA